MPVHNLALIGFMGVGKSTVGRLCAKQLGYTFLDSDAVIAERAGCPVAQFFAERGEAAFRALEREVIAELAARPGIVLSTGGGVVLDAANVANLRAGGLVVLLTASVEVVLRRVGDRNSRPLLASASDPRARVLQLLAERAPYYERAAHCRVETTDRRPGQVAAQVVKLYRQAEDADGRV